MDYTKQTETNYTLLTLGGELDVTVAGELQKLLKNEIMRGKVALIVDMSGVAFIDSSCLGVIVSAHKVTLQHQSTLFLAGMTPQVRKIFDLTQTSKYLSLFDSVEAAKVALKPSRA